MATDRKSIKQEKFSLFYVAYRQFFFCILPTFFGIWNIKEYPNDINIYMIKALLTNILNIVCQNCLLSFVFGDAPVTLQHVTFVFIMGIIFNYMLN